MDKSSVRTIEEMLGCLLPSVDRLYRPYWFPDAFAMVASILKHSGAYTEAANKWPPRAYRPFLRWHETIVRLSNEWRNAYEKKPSWPDQLEKWWKVVLANLPLALRDVKSKPRLVTALIGIVAAADNASDGFGYFELRKGRPVHRIASTNLAVKQSLCLDIEPSRAVVLPKAHNPLSGLTLRSWTHNLAFWDRAEVQPRWEKIPARIARDGMNILLLPWPLNVSPKSFREVEEDCGLGFPPGSALFSYEMSEEAKDVNLICDLVTKAEGMIGPVDAIVFPELTMREDDFDVIHRALEPRVVVAGIGSDRLFGELGYNEVTVAVDWASNAPPFKQSKHHRWRIDSPQCRDYGLGAVLHDKECWWEAIKIKERECRFYCSNEWLSFCVLICEDLARQDPIAELVRSVGPNLVVALLLDGPQRPDRWSSRYATVLADDPRSSVLTLTCAGLVDLNLSQFGGGERVIGLWRDAKSGTRQIALEHGSQAVALSLRREMELEWTADGRHDDQATGYLKLAGIYQVSAPGSRSSKSKTTRRKRTNDAKGEKTTTT